MAIPRITTVTVTCPACDNLHMAAFDYFSGELDLPVYSTNCPNQGGIVEIVLSWTIQVISVAV